VAALFDIFAATFLSVDEDEDESDVAVSFFDGVDGLNGGAAGGDDVVNDDDRIAGREISFDPFLSAVFFHGFADGKNLEWSSSRSRIFTLRGNADAKRDWIGAEGEAADGVDLFVQLRGGCFHQRPADLADKAGAARIERSDAGVDVKVALRAGGECEFAVADGFFLEQGAQLVFGGSFGRVLHSFHIINCEEQRAKRKEGRRQNGGESKPPS